MSLATGAVSVMLPVEDVDRARKFYEEKVGLQFKGLDEFEGSAMFSLEGGTTLVLLPRPGGTRNESTAMSWAVEDVEQEVKELETQGVTFEDYDLPRAQDRRPHRLDGRLQVGLVQGPGRQRALRAHPDARECGLSSGAQRTSWISRFGQSCRPAAACRRIRP